MGTTGNAHAVRLFPESCSCPSTGRCYHLLAAQMSVGLLKKQCQQKVNLTQLRSNTRSKKDKKSGRKAPRSGDYEVIPAPDSSFTLVRYRSCLAISQSIFFSQGRGERRPFSNLQRSVPTSGMFMEAFQKQ